MKEVGENQHERGVIKHVLRAVEDVDDEFTGVREGIGWKSNKSPSADSGKWGWSVRCMTRQWLRSFFFFLSLTFSYFFFFFIPTHSYPPPPFPVSFFVEFSEFTPYLFLFNPFFSNIIRVPFLAFLCVLVGINVISRADPCYRRAFGYCIVPNILDAYLTPFLNMNTC